eukprot:TRINITY_DN2515_c0_g1_i1.p1 TRINITY_DN2515_c0_g1~~TRINITY_DN2515_c0_g1_i1.p1  ORF type:complete len:489 (+),score=113.33 TRINITY_DN2515_c0_g1_i1:41-1507(+)
MQKEDFVVLDISAQLPLIQEGLDNHEVSRLTWFCEQHTPKPDATLEEKEELLSSLNQASDQKELLESILSSTVMKTPTQDPDLFVSAMWLFSKLDGLEQTVSEVGGLAHLISVVNLHVPNLDKGTLIANGLRTIACLACDKEVREAMVLEGVMHLIVSVLKSRAIGDKEITLACLSALNNILFQCLSNKQSFVREGGVGPLFAAIRSYIEAKDLKVLELCVVTLRNLCSISNPYASPSGDDHRIALINEGTIKLLLDLSNLYPMSETIQTNVIWSLLNISINSRAIKWTINQEHAIPVVYEIIRNHKDNLELVYNGVSLLNQISTRTTTRVAVAKEGGVQVILDILYANEGQYKLQSMCLTLIDILCTLSLCRKRIAQENRLRNLLSWLMKEENMARREYVESGLNICQKLAMSAAESKQALQDCSGYTFFVTVNSVYNDDQDIQYLTVTGMGSLSDAAEYENESSEEEVLSSDGEEDDDDDGDYEAY